MAQWDHNGKLEQLFGPRPTLFVEVPLDRSIVRGGLDVMSAEVSLECREGLENSQHPQVIDMPLLVLAGQQPWI